jgi:mediator of RNA polymerase II transcription subunit 12
METNEDDDVFSSGVPPTGHHTIKQEHKTSKCQAEDEPQTHRLPSTRKRTKSGSLTVTIESSNFSGLNEAGGTGGTPGLVGNEEEGTGCKHHSSLLLQLSCIIQVVAVQCPTAFINVSLTGKGGREYIPKAATPLDKLPLRLSAMPLPKKMTEKKLESILSLTEHDIRQRTNVADSGWSAMAVPDLQTSNKGRIVMEVLKVLKVLDGHSFTTCKYHSPLSTLYVKIYQVYKNTESFFQSTDSLCMLLCQWAVTPHRTGIHRPLVSARLLKRIQHDKLQGQVLTDLDSLDEYWEYPETGFYGDIATFPFQQILFQFLDTRASLPESLYFPLKNNESFKHLLTLFADLIHLHVFSYSLYLSTLIARGDTRSPVIPLLPFFKGESGNPPLLIDSEVKELNLSIPLSLIPNFLKAKRPTTLDTIVQGSSEGTISPRLPSAFGSQDNLLETLGSFGTPSFGQEEHMKMETSTLFMPSEELMMDPLEEGPSQLVSPVGFGSHASSPIKQDVFDFSLNFLDEPPSSNHSMEDIALQPTSTTAATTTSAVPTTTLDPVTHKHLIYATYFPLSPADISGQDLTQRSVVLCGTGQSRAKVNQVVDELRNRSHDLILALSAVHSPVFNQATVEFLSEFKLLPTFEQNFIACNCVQTILSVTISNKTFPSCSQVLLACEMLELSGSHYKLVQFLIELITCEEERERKEARQHSIPIPLPSILCIPVINILWNYLSILLLSSHDTLVVYERLYRVLDNNIAQPTKYTTAQKAVFLFLKHLQTHCYYVEVCDTVQL